MGSFNNGAFYAFFNIKASFMGSSVTVFIEGSSLLLGTWQGIFLGEFDGPRTRRVIVRVEGG